MDTNTLNRLFVDSLKPKAKAWICSICTFNNTSNINRCEMCDTPKTVCIPSCLLSKSFHNKVNQQEPKDKQGWICSNCTFLNDASVSICGACNSKIQNDKDLWSCSKCNFKNQLQSLQCLMCDTPKPVKLLKYIF